MKQQTVRFAGVTMDGGSVRRDEAPMNRTYVALCDISQKWTLPIRDWKAVLKRFRIDSEMRIAAL